MAKNLSSAARIPQKRGGTKWYIYALVCFSALLLLCSVFLLWDTITNPDDSLWSKLGQAVSGASRGGDIEDFNIIVAGLDNVGDTRRTDSIIVAHISMKNKIASVVFIPRDSRVAIPGRRGFDKINAAYSYGEIDLMKSTIEQFLGIEVNNYAILYVSGFIKLIDALGGVDNVCVEKRMKYTDRAQNLHIDLQPGCQTLDGEKAMQYARFRHDAEGDFGRIRRQQQIMKLLSEKALSTDIFKNLPKIIGVLSSEKLVSTNMSMDEMLSLAHNYNRDMFNNLNVHMLLGVPQTISGISYVVPDADDMPYLVGSVFRDGFDPHNKKVKIEVLNGNRFRSMAEIFARRLGYYGFDVIGTGNAKSFDNERTQVVVHRDTPYAAAVAKMLDAETVSQPDPNAVADIQVIIGRDKSR